MNQISETQYNFLKNDMGLNKKMIDLYFEDLDDTEQMKFLNNIDKIIVKNTIIKNFKIK